MKKEDQGTPMKVTIYFKKFINNSSATRRTEIKGKSIDKEQLTQTQMQDHVATFFKDEDEIYLKMINKEYIKNG